MATSLHSAVRSVGWRLGWRLGLIAVSALIAVLPFEGWLRWREAAERGARGRFHEPRPDRPWLYGLRPGAEGTIPQTGNVRYRVNADGFRDRLYTRPKPNATRRVVVLGDSVAFGWGVEEWESFPKVLESMFEREASAAPTEVMNLGVNGYNAYTEARLFEDVGSSYEPDWVVVQFCINDLDEPTLHFDAQTRVALGAIPDAAFPDPRRRSADPASRSAWIGICRRLRICARVDDWLMARARPAPGAAALDASLSSGAHGERPEWTWLEARYRELARAASEVGARFVVLATPYPQQLGSHSVHPVQRRLVEMAERNDWLIANPLPAFRAARAKRKRSLFLDYWHPSPRGHRIIATTLHRSLVCAGLHGDAESAGCPTLDSGGSAVFAPGAMDERTSAVRESL